MKYRINPILFVVFLVFVSQNLFATPKYDITGQVKDKNTKENLEFCSVIIYSTKDSLISASVTNSKGFFKIPLSRGEYKIVLSFIGYKTDTIRISVVNKSIFLGVFRMEIDENTLDEINVSASTNQNKLDKEVQLVTKDVKTGTGKAADVMDKMKGLSYDRYNNSIKVDGDDNIKILVNGLEKDPEYIKNLSPERLKAIEIIRNPSGRYAIEGYSAVINVILKSDYRGTEVYIENQALIDLDTKISEYVVVNNFSGTVNYTYDKLNFYAKYNNHRTNVHVPFSIYKTYSDNMTVEYDNFNDSTNFAIFNTGNKYTFGFDYYLNPKHTISFESNTSAFPPHSSLTHQKSDVSYFVDNILTDNYISETNNSSNSTNYTNSIFYIGKFDENNTLNADFTYTDYTDNFTNKYNETTGFERIDKGSSLMNSTKFYIEYNHTFNSKSSVIFGYGNTWRRVETNSVANTILYSTTDILNDTTKFLISDMRNKAYAYYSWKPNKKLGLKIGSAAEHSKPVVNGLSRDFIIYQPHFDIMYKPVDFLTFKLKYRSNSNYPSIPETIPVTTVIDQNTVETGNPYLKPEVIHKVSLRLDALGGVFGVEPYYDYSNNFIGKIITQTDINSYIYSYDNVGEYIHKGIKGNITIPLFKQTLIIQSNFNYFRSSIDYFGHNNNLNDLRLKEQIIYINKKYKTVTGIIYQKDMVKRILSYGYGKSNNDYWLFLFQQPFFKEKLTLMLAYMLPTDLWMDYDQGSYTKTDTYTELNVVNIDLIKHVVIFRLSYRFDKGRKVKKTEKDIEEENNNKSKGIF